MAVYQGDTCEFDLVVRIKGQKDEPYDPYQRQEKEPEIVVKEELKFNSLDAVSVIRKLLDYVRS